MRDRHNANAIAGNVYRRRHERNSMPGPRHRYDRLRCATLQEHTSSDVRDMASRVEPRVRGKAAPKQ